MGYQIQYGQTMVKTQYRGSGSQKRVLPIVLLLSMCALLIIVFLWGDSAAVREFLLPGNAGVTEAALNSLVENLRDGEPFGVAITVFCQEIIENAGIPLSTV